MYSKRLVLAFCSIFLIYNISWGQTHKNIYGVGVQINTNNPKYPFPQFRAYKEGLNLSQKHAIGVTDAEMEKTTYEAYFIMMNRMMKDPTGDFIPNSGNKVDYLVFNHPSGKEFGSGTFVSEGEGYAMLAAAYLADQKTFNGLWCWVHDNRMSSVKRYADGQVTRPTYRWGGLPGWKSDKNYPSTSGDANSAADGDFDIGMALLVAARQWPSDGINDDNNTFHSYRNIAKDFLNLMVDTLFVPDANGLRAQCNPSNAGTADCGYYSGDIGMDG